MAKTKTKSSLKSSKTAKGLSRLQFLSFKSLMAISVAVLFAAGGLMYSNNGSAAGCHVYPLHLSRTKTRGPWVTVPSWSYCKDVNIGRVTLKNGAGGSTGAYFRTEYYNGGGSNWVFTSTGYGLEVIDYNIPNGTKYRISMSNPSDNNAYFNVYD